MPLDDFERGKLSVHAANYLADLERFVKSIRHAQQLFADGFSQSGEEQVYAAVRQLDGIKD